MPESWSKKKKERMNLKPHQQTPDADNLFKAFTDTLFY
jgi:Holliday junction resolvase RusA-like endonuclease